MKCKVKNFIQSVRLISDNTPKNKSIKENLKTLFNDGGFEVNDENADLTIFIGGDGTFVDGCNIIDFSKNTICLGVNNIGIGILHSYKGTYEKIIKYLSEQNYVHVRKIPLLDITILNKYKKPMVIQAVNDFSITGKRLSLINYNEMFDDIHFQRCNSCKIIVSSSINCKAEFQKYNFPILVDDDKRLVRDIIGINHSKAENPFGCLKYRIDINTIYDEAEIEIDGKVRYDIKANEILSVEIKYSNEYINILDLEYFVQ